MSIRFIPFGAWPADRPRTKVRLKTATKRSSAQLMREIEAEVTRVGGKAPSVEVAMTAHELRRDGLFYKGAAPKDPGLVLRFTDKQGRPIVMPSDRYTTVEGNLFALAKTLEALRTVDRHGVALSGEQYTGWAQLPPAGGSTPAMTLDEAVAFVASIAIPTSPDSTAVVITESSEFAKTAIRTARSRTHPDAGGSAADFARVEEAARIISTHHGVEL